MKIKSRRNFLKISSIAGVGIFAGCYKNQKFDIIIKNGTVFDGLNNPGQKVDLGIVGDKIQKIGDLSAFTAKTEIDARDLYVSPGFIDIHSHTDIEILVNPKAESKIRQGITTDVSGNCGDSPFPLNKNDAEEMAESAKSKYGVDANWNHITGFFSQIVKQGLGINYATFTGHGDLRAFVVGRQDLKPSIEQIEKMKSVLEQSMKNGSLGLSTGLEYSPSNYAKTDELIELCKVVKKYNGVYATHMRSEDDKVEEAIVEAIKIAKETGVSLQISHFKACNKSNWHKVDNMLKLVHDAKTDGVDILVDRYPYNAWGTGLSSFLPLWARQGNTDDILARLKNPGEAVKIKNYMKNRIQLIGGWNRIMISSCNLEQNKKWQGKYIDEAARQSGQEATQFIFELLASERNKVGVIGFAMDEGNLKKVLADPLTMIGSDGTAAAPYGKLHKGNPHPRYYGTFPRVLGKYCREEKLFNWEIAIMKMTSMPARKLRLKHRGEINTGFFADITIFNPNTVIDKATFINPHQYPEGIGYVILNGKVVIQNGIHTNVLNGGY